jgi:hypothetical protein
MSTDLQSPQANTSPEPSLTQLVSGIVSDAQTLLKQQLAMFRTEIKMDVRRTKQALVALICGSAVASIGVILLCFGLVYGLAALAPQLPLWACFAIVGGVFAIGGGLAFYSAVRQFHEFNPLPDESAQALKENVQWISQPR